MVQIPIRGLFFLGRTAVIIAAAAAVPYIIKKNKRLGDQIGDALIKAGENIKGDGAKPAGSPKTTQTVKSAPKEAAAKTATRASSKPKAARKRTAKKKPTASGKPADA